MDVRVILEKDGLYGVLTIVPYNNGYLLACQDARLDEPVAHIVRDAEEAYRRFNEAISVSVERDWSVLYYGKPHYG